MTRAAVYCRVSTDLQGDNGTSLDTQLAGCRAYCQRLGYSIVDEVQEARSGATLDRPGLRALRERIGRGEVDALVVYDLDRLSRSQNHHGVLFCEIEEVHGARIESATQDANGPGWIVIRTFAGLLAEMEREKIRERTMRGRRARIEEGHLPTTGFASYGFEYVQPSKEQRSAGLKARRAVIEHEAATVRRIFEGVASGLPLRAVANGLNDEGVPSPGSRLHYREERSDRWTATGLRVILRNPAYMGLTVAGRFKMKSAKVKVEQERELWTVLNLSGPAIVSEGLWRSAYERLQANRGAVTWNKGQPMLLRGRIVCGECGSLVYAGADSRAGRRNHYRCRSGHEGRRGVQVDQAELDGWVWSQVERVLGDRDRIVAELRARLEGVDDSGLRLRAERLREHVQRLGRQKQALNRVLSDSEGAMTWADIEPEMRRLKEEEERSTAALASIESHAGEGVAKSARLEAVDVLVRRLGTRLAEPDHATKVQVITELGLTVRATKRWQDLRWSIPTSDGEESGWSALIDLSGVAEPDEAARESVLEEERGEAMGDGGGACSRGRAAIWAIRCGRAIVRRRPSSAIRSGSADRCWTESTSMSRPRGSTMRSWPTGGQGKGRTWCGGVWRPPVPGRPLGTRGARCTRTRIWGRRSWRRSSSSTRPATR